jgi:hypothetical protein
VRLLRYGDAQFKFTCKVADQLETEELEQLSAVVNVSSFVDEEAENHGTPKVDTSDPGQLALYTAILTKSSYVLPCVRAGAFNSALVGSLRYQKACQTGSPTFTEEKCDDAKRMFTFVRTLVPMVYWMTIQLKCSEVTDAASLKGLQTVEGIAPTKALLLERVRDPDDPSQNDSTVKVKSLLLFFDLPNGNVFASNLTVVLNTSIPGVIAGIIGTFSKSGIAEAVQTCVQTRAFLRESGLSTQPLSAPPAGGAPDDSDGAPT